MLERPHTSILDRDSARAVVDEHFPRQTELLRDLANYGSNLVIRVYNSSPKGMADLVVCGVLVKQVVAMIDAVEVLLSAGCGLASFLPARTAFEASVYADWIMSENSERRATCYVVANYRDERTWAERAIPGTNEERAFSQIANSMGLDIHTTSPTIASEGSSHLSDVNRILAQPQLQSIDAEFTARRGNKRHDPEWYQLDGVRSIRQVAESVNRLPEYEFFYSRGSQVAHTGTYKDHVRFRCGGVRFKPIRQLADVNLLLNFVVVNGFGTYRRVLTKYRPGEIDAFVRKYGEDWREPFQNVVSVRYDF